MQICDRSSGRLRRRYAPGLRIVPSTDRRLPAVWHIAPKQAAAPPIRSLLQLQVSRQSDPLVRFHKLEVGLCEVCVPAPVPQTLVCPCPEPSPATPYLLLLLPHNNSMIFARLICFVAIS